MRLKRLSVHTLFDASGRIAWQAQHSVWGKAEVVAGDGSPQPLRYPGQYHDAGTGLHYNTFRYYDPESGRYLTPDPIGLDGGFNLYSYVHDPLSWMDPWGWNKNSNGTVGDWVLYEVSEPTTGKIAKAGIGKAEDVMATTGKNRRAHTSGRTVKKRDPVNFPNAEAEVKSEHKGITKAKMKEIEAARVRELRNQGHELPHNRERDARYKADKKAGGC